MKSYKEIAEDVFKRRDEYFAAKKTKRSVWLKNISIALSCCVLVIAGIGILKSSRLRSNPSDQDSSRIVVDGIISPEIEDNTDKKNPVSTTKDSDIVTTLADVTATTGKNDSSYMSTTVVSTGNQTSEGNNASSSAYTSFTETTAASETSVTTTDAHTTSVSETTSFSETTSIVTLSSTTESVIPTSTTTTTTTTTTATTTTITTSTIYPITTTIGISRSMDMFSGKSSDTDYGRITSEIPLKKIFSEICLKFNEKRSVLSFKDAEPPDKKINMPFYYGHIRVRSRKKRVIYLL